MTASSTTTTVSDIQIIPVKPRDGLIGFVSFVVDGKLYIGSVAVYTLLNGQGIRLVYPKKNQINCVHPVTRSAGDAITQAVQKKFNDLYPSFQNLYESEIEQSAIR